MSVTYSQISDIFCVVADFSEITNYESKPHWLNPFSILGNYAFRDKKPHTGQKGSPHTSSLYVSSLAEEHGTCTLLVKGLSPSHWRKLSSFPKYTVSEKMPIEQ